MDGEFLVLSYSLAELCCNFQYEQNMFVCACVYACVCVCVCAGTPALGWSVMTTPLDLC